MGYFAEHPISFSVYLSLCSAKVESYTQIENDVLEKIISLNLSGTAMSCFFYLLRKTNGFQKEQDGISLSQFMSALNRTKPTIIKALRELQLVKVVLLVKKGTCGKAYSVWKICKDVSAWRLVKKPLLVKKWKRTGKEMETTLVKVSLHTKENNTKENIQKKRVSKDTVTEVTYGNGDVNKLIKGINGYLNVKLPDNGEARRYARNALQLFTKRKGDRTIKQGREWMDEDKFQNAKRFLLEYGKAKEARGFSAQSWSTLYRNIQLWVANMGSLSFERSRNEKN